MVWRNAYEDFLIPAVAAIRAGQMENAHLIYQKLLERMATISGFRAAVFNPKIDSSTISIGKPI